MALTHEQIVNQSKSAMRQWETQWRAQAKENSVHEMRSFDDFEGSGAGKACLLVANGASFEDNIATIREHHANVDVLACDKTLGHCIRNGIKPTYVLVCDANVNYEKYMQPYEDQLQDTILVMNVCANPKWAANGNWKAKYFFCVKDVIESEKIFAEISGCHNLIAAATNVSNSMVVFMTQCDNNQRQNFFGYDKYLLVGFDYCWTIDGNYYAFDHEGGGKRYYMRHVYGRTISGTPCYTSNNLAFSMQWLESYARAFGLPLVQCGAQAVFIPPGQRKPARLEDHITYRGTQDPERTRQLFKKRRELVAARAKIEEELKQARNAQFYDFMQSL